MSSTTRHSRNGKMIEINKKMSGCQGFGERGGMIGRAHRIFMALKILHVIP